MLVTKKPSNEITNITTPNVEPVLDLLATQNGTETTNIKKNTTYRNLILLLVFSIVTAEILYPQFGHDLASEETSFLHSGHLTNISLPHLVLSDIFIMFSLIQKNLVLLTQEKINQKEPVPHAVLLNFN